MKRPSPALVLATVAVFASFGGTGYAASRIGSPARQAKRASRPLTTKQIEKLVGTYIKHHHLGGQGAPGPAGDVGATGPAGTPGSPGSPGPRAVLVSANQEGVVAERPVDSADGITVEMECKASALKGDIVGNGTAVGLTTLENLGGGSPGVYPVNYPIHARTGGEFGNGIAEIHEYVTIESKIVDVDVDFLANPAGSGTCSATGYILALN